MYKFQSPSIFFRWDVYIYSPCGMKFASKKKLAKFLEMTNQSLDPENFDFTPYGQQQDPEQLPNQETSAHFGSSRNEDQYAFPRIQNTESPVCTHLHVHGGTQSNAHLQLVDPVIMIENNPNSIIHELAQPQVLNLSLNQTTFPQPLREVHPVHHHLERVEREKQARAKMLATKINAATRDDESTSSMMTSSTMSTMSEQQQTFNCTYKATTSNCLSNFHIIESYDSLA